MYSFNALHMYPPTIEHKDCAQVVADESIPETDATATSANTSTILPRSFDLQIGRLRGLPRHTHHLLTFMRAHISNWKDKLRRRSSQCKPTEEQITASMALRELGNEHFKAGQYKEAEELYSQAYAP